MKALLFKLSNVAKRLGLRSRCVGTALVMALLLSAMNSHAATDDFYLHGLPAAKAGNFPEAAAAFERDLKVEPSSGAFVNLGVVEWQRGHAGAAILAWERAIWINPYDARADQNLKFARTMAQVDAPDLRWFEKPSTWLPSNAWLWVAGAGFWLAMGMLVLPRVFRWRKSGWQQPLVALGFCILLFGLTASVGVVSRTDIGFIVKNNAALRLTPTSGSEFISAVSVGEPFRREKARGNFYFIRTTMTAGWIEKSQVGLINE